MSRADPPPLVLIVDDEALLRMSAADILTEHGYETIEAANAAEALAIIGSQPDRVRVLFSDVNMPGEADGLDLARQVHERWPKVRLLLTSGREIMTARDVPDDGDFVRKPYGAQELLSRVDALMAQKVE